MAGNFTPKPIHFCGLVDSNLGLWRVFPQQGDSVLVACGTLVHNQPGIH